MHLTFRMLTWSLWSTMLIPSPEEKCQNFNHCNPLYWSYITLRLVPLSDIRLLFLSQSAHQTLVLTVLLHAGRGAFIVYDGSKWRLAVKFCCDSYIAQRNYVTLYASVCDLWSGDKVSFMGDFGFFRRRVPQSSEIIFFIQSIFLN